MRAKETLICIVAVALLIYSLVIFAGVGRKLDRLTDAANSASDKLGELKQENSRLRAALEAGMSDEELEDASEVFELPNGQYLIVEG